MVGGRGIKLEIKLKTYLKRNRMNNWKELKESFVEVYKDKLRVELKVIKINPLEWYKELIVKIMHPCADPCEEELLVYLDDTESYANPWIHYSEKVEADLDEFIGIKLAEQREREELEKPSASNDVITFVDVPSAAVISVTKFFEVPRTTSVTVFQEVELLSLIQVKSG